MKLSLKIYERQSFIKALSSRTIARDHISADAFALMCDWIAQLKLDFSGDADRNDNFLMMLYTKEL